MIPYALLEKFPNSELFWSVFSRIWNYMDTFYAVMASNICVFKYERHVGDYSEYTRTFPYLKHLQAIGPSFVIMTRTLSNKVAKIFCKELK